MKATHPAFKSPRESRRVEAIEAEHTFVPNQQIFIGQEIPDSDFSSTGGKFQTLRTLPKRVRRPGLFRNVSNRSNHAGGISLRIPCHDLAPIMHQQILARFRPQPNLQFLDEASTGEVFRNSLPDGLAVVRVYKLEKELDPLWNVFPGMSEQGSPPRAIVNFAGQDIPIPETLGYRIKGVGGADFHVVFQSSQVACGRAQFQLSFQPPAEARQISPLFIRQDTGHPVDQAESAHSQTFRCPNWRPGVRTYVRFSRHQR